jgi:hypothetical protein
MLSFLFGSWPRKKSLSQPRCPARPRLSIETLEERTVPSTFWVLNTNDSGPGSLRQAVLDANGASGPDMIRFARDVRGEIGLTGGELTITDDLTIRGLGQNKLTVSGENSSCVFRVDSRPILIDVKIRDLTIANGLVLGGIGGGIFNDSTLTLTDSVVSHNQAIGKASVTTAAVPGYRESSESIKSRSP